MPILFVAGIVVFIMGLFVTNQAITPKSAVLGICIATVGFVLLVIFGVKVILMFV